MKTADSELSALIRVIRGGSQLAVTRDCESDADSLYSRGAHLSRTSPWVSRGVLRSDDAGMVVRVAEGSGSHAQWRTVLDSAHGAFGDVAFSRICRRRADVCRRSGEPRASLPRARRVGVLRRLYGDVSCLAKSVAGGERRSGTSEPVAGRRPSHRSKPGPAAADRGQTSPGSDEARTRVRLTVTRWNLEGWRQGDEGWRSIRRHRIPSTNLIDENLLHVSRVGAPRTSRGCR